MDAFARPNDDWVPLAVLLKEVRAIQPQSTPKDYGSAKPMALVRKPAVSMPSCGVAR
jgi:hypothetical protein